LSNSLLLSRNPFIPFLLTGDLTSIASTRRESIADSYPYGFISELGMESSKPPASSDVNANLQILLEANGETAFNLLYKLLFEQQEMDGQQEASQAF
jgi:hypothetical protein